MSEPEKSRPHEPECMCDVEDKPELSQAELEELEANEEAELYEVDEDDAGVGEE